MGPLTITDASGRTPPADRVGELDLDLPRALLTWDQLRPGAAEMRLTSRVARVSPLFIRCTRTQASQHLAARPTPESMAERSRFGAGGLGAEHPAAAAENGRPIRFCPRPSGR